MWNIYPYSHIWIYGIYIHIWIYPISIIHIPIYPYIHISLHPYIHISIYPYIHISIYTYIHMEGWPYGEVIFYGYISIYTGDMEGWLYLLSDDHGTGFQKRNCGPIPWIVYSSWLGWLNRPYAGHQCHLCISRPKVIRGIGGAYCLIISF